MRAGRSRAALLAGAVARPRSGGMIETCSIGVGGVGVGGRGGICGGPGGVCGGAGLFFGGAKGDFCRAVVGRCGALFVFVSAGGVGFAGIGVGGIFESGASGGSAG